MIFHYLLQKDLKDFYKIVIYGNNLKDSKVQCKICDKHYNYLSFKTHFRVKHHNVHYYLDYNKNASS